MFPTQSFFVDTLEEALQLKYLLDYMIPSQSIRIASHSIRPKPLVDSLDLNCVSSMSAPDSHTQVRARELREELGFVHLQQPMVAPFAMGRHALGSNAVPRRSLVHPVTSATSSFSTSSLEKEASQSFSSHPPAAQGIIELGYLQRLGLAHILVPEGQEAASVYLTPVSPPDVPASDATSSNHTTPTSTATSATSSSESSSSGPSAPASRPINSRPLNSLSSSQDFEFDVDAAFFPTDAAYVEPDLPQLPKSKRFGAPEDEDEAETETGSVQDDNSKEDKSNTISTPTSSSPPLSSSSSSSSSWSSSPKYTPKAVSTVPLPALLLPLVPTGYTLATELTLSRPLLATLTDRFFFDPEMREQMIAEAPLAYCVVEVLLDYLMHGRFAWKDDYKHFISTYTNNQFLFETKKNLCKDLPIHHTPAVPVTVSPSTIIQLLQSPWLAHANLTSKMYPDLLKPDPTEQNLMMFRVLGDAHEKQVLHQLRQNLTPYLYNLGLLPYRNITKSAFDKDTSDELPTYVCNSKNIGYSRCVDAGGSALFTDLSLTHQRDGGQLDDFYPPQAAKDVAMGKMPVDGNPEKEKSDRSSTFSNLDVQYERGSHDTIACMQRGDWLIYQAPLCIPMHHLQTTLKKTIFDEMLKKMMSISDKHTIKLRNGMVLTKEDQVHIIQEFSKFPINHPCMQALLLGVDYTSWDAAYNADDDTSAAASASSSSSSSSDTEGEGASASQDDISSSSSSSPASPGLPSVPHLVVVGAQRLSAKAARDLLCGVFQGNRTLYDQNNTNASINIPSSTSGASNTEIIIDTLKNTHEVTDNSLLISLFGTLCKFTGKHSDLPPLGPPAYGLTLRGSVDFLVRVPPAPAAKQAREEMKTDGDTGADADADVDADGDDAIEYEVWDSKYAHSCNPNAVFQTTLYAEVLNVLLAEQHARLAAQYEGMPEEERKRTSRPKRVRIRTCGLILGNLNGVTYPMTFSGKPVILSALGLYSGFLHNFHPFSPPPLPTSVTSVPDYKSFILRQWKDNQTFSLLNSLRDSQTATFNDLGLQNNVDLTARLLHSKLASKLLLAPTITGDNRVFGATVSPTTSTSSSSASALANDDLHTLIDPNTIPHASITTPTPTPVLPRIPGYVSLRTDQLALLVDVTEVEIILLAHYIKLCRFMKNGETWSSEVLEGDLPAALSPFMQVHGLPLLQYIEKLEQDAMEPSAAASAAPDPAVYMDLLVDFAITVANLGKHTSSSTSPSSSPIASWLFPSLPASKHHLFNQSTLDKHAAHAAAIYLSARVQALAERFRGLCGGGNDEYVKEWYGKLSAYAQGVANSVSSSTSSSASASTSTSASSVCFSPLQCLVYLSGAAPLLVQNNIQHITVLPPPSAHIPENPEKYQIPENLENPESPQNPLISASEIPDGGDVFLDLESVTGYGTVVHLDSHTPVDKSISIDTYRAYQLWWNQQQQQQQQQQQSDSFSSLLPGLSAPVYPLASPTALLPYAKLDKPPTPTQLPLRGGLPAGPWKLDYLIGLCYQERASRWLAETSIRIISNPESHFPENIPKDAYFEVCMMDPEEELVILTLYLDARGDILEQRLYNKGIWSCDVKYIPEIDPYNYPQPATSTSASSPSASPASALTVADVAALISRGSIAVFRDWWAHTPAQEKLAFEACVDWLVKRHKAFPRMNVYHFASYEPTVFKEMSRKYHTREKEVAMMIGASVPKTKTAKAAAGASAAPAARRWFVDVYPIASQLFSMSVKGHSLKRLEGVVVQAERQRAEMWGMRLARTEAETQVEAKVDDSWRKEPPVNNKNYKDMKGVQASAPIPTPASASPAVDDLGLLECLLLEPQWAHAHAHTHAHTDASASASTDPHLIDVASPAPAVVAQLHDLIHAIQSGHSQSSSAPSAPPSPLRRSSAGIQPLNTLVASPHASLARQLQIAPSSLLQQREGVADGVDSMVWYSQWLHSVGSWVRKGGKGGNVRGTQCGVPKTLPVAKLLTLREYNKRDCVNLMLLTRVLWNIRDQMQAHNNIRPYTFENVAVLPDSDHSPADYPSRILENVTKAKKAAAERKKFKLGQ